MEGLTKSQRYLIVVLIKTIRRMNTTTGGEVKAGKVLRSVVTDLINSLYARMKRKGGGLLAQAIKDNADFKEL